MLVAHPAASVPTVAAALAALLRALPSDLTRLFPTCPIHQTLGILCPGCGATHALLALVHGQLAAAWQANALLILALPLALAGGMLRLRRNQPDRLSLSSPSRARVIAALLAVTAVFTVARNLSR